MVAAFAPTRETMRLFDIYTVPGGQAPLGIRLPEEPEEAVVRRSIGHIASGGITDRHTRTIPQSARLERHPITVSALASSRLRPVTTDDQLDVLRRELFHALADWWRDATLHLSSPSEIGAHPAYQKIIAMGEDAIPLILEDLRDRGGKWYMALRRMVTDPPVIDSASSGNTSRVKEIWLEWGRQHGYRV